MKASKLALLGCIFLLATGSLACNKLKARDQLNKGVLAFRNAQFQSAIEHFREAVRDDPELLNARLFLATSYAQQYIPGGESKENVKVGEEAINAFEDVLRMARPEKDKDAIAGALAYIGIIYYGMKKFDKAKEYQTRRMEIEPGNPEPYYWVGVLDWSVCFPIRMQLRKDLNVANPVDPAKPDSLPPLPAKAIADLRDQNGKLVDEGIGALKKALDLRPNYSDAMAYLNLMYREKADLEEDPSARDGDLKQAEDWVTKAIAIRRQTAGGQPSG